METTAGQPTAKDIWDEEHLKALLRFPRYPTRLIQQEPWRSWIDQHNGMRAIYAYLQSYPLSPSQSKLLEVVLSHPETLADTCAERLHISRATYFYRLRDLLPTLAHALNQWKVQALEPPAAQPAPAPARPLPASLPSPLTTLVGVEAILAAIGTLVQRPDVHLVTLSGPGGCGKTRLAIEVARILGSQFLDGTIYVSLAPLQDYRAVAPALAQALGLAAEGQPAGAPEIAEHLRGRHSLLVLDNFEHVLPAAALVSELLARAPRLKLLITSRAVLHLYGEHVFSVPELTAAAAGELFLQRAQAVNPHFAPDDGGAETIAQLCAELEGLPLAVELAAAQIKVLTPKAMLARCARRLDLLAHGPCDLAPRQQSLRNSLRWSYGLLSTQQALLLDRLAVFVGGFRIEAAEAICTAPGDADLPVIAGLMALVDQSLLQKRVDPDGEPRFVLRETTREYALEQLELRGELTVMRQAHARYYLALAEPPELEAGNLRAAWHWAREHPDEVPD